MFMRHLLPAVRFSNGHATERGDMAIFCVLSQLSPNCAIRGEHGARGEAPRLGARRRGESACLTAGAPAEASARRCERRFIVAA
jgi:hypothetical protein